MRFTHNSAAHKSVLGDTGSSVEKNRLALAKSKTELVTKVNASDEESQRNSP